MTFAAGNVTANVYGMQTNGGASFSGGSSSLTTPFGTNGGVTMQGFFAGANASHAGITYAINAGGTIGDIGGAAAFKQSGTSPVPQ